jgi:hypothetical protein
MSGFLLSILVPVSQKVNDSIGKPMFMQDNSPVHKASSAMDWPDENEIPAVIWPPYSADMNPLNTF